MLKRRNVIKYCDDLMKKQRTNQDKMANLGRERDYKVEKINREYQSQIDNCSKLDESLSLQIEMVKKYVANDKTYTFDVEYTEVTWRGTVWLGKCRENGKDAWIDSHGIQFVGECRFAAKQVDMPDSNFPYGRIMWGGELRNARPRGARYYTNRRN
jgi:hypothetical protein